MYTMVLTTRQRRLATIFVVSLLLFAESFMGYKVHVLSARQEKIKEDYTTVNNISFGLLSVDEWRNKVSDVVTHRIRNFDLSADQEKNLKVEIEQILHSLIRKAVGMIEKPQKSIGGKLKKLAFKTFVDEDKIQARVPEFANAIIAKVKSPESKKRLASVVESKMQELEETTYDSTEQVHDRINREIFRNYKVADVPAFNNKVTALLADLRLTTYTYASSMLGCVVMVLLVWWLLRKSRDIYITLYILSILAALILLLVGLTTTMIEVDARIKTLHFLLLGEKIEFRDQVLFFQSKSIIDVVHILIQTGKYDSILVGILILCFSILFPMVKLLSTGIYLLGKKKWSQNKVIGYFAFHSGKWSMADVMVVAILMAYIGFNGIIGSQLANLNIHTGTLTSITTNNTSLQPGYLIFVAFVIYGLVLSQILKWITRPRGVNN